MLPFKEYFTKIIERSSKLLVEGGNVFKQNPTQRIYLADIPPTIEFLSRIVGKDLSKNLLGSTGKRESSGDLDIAINSNKISKEQLYNILVDWCKERNLNPKDYIAKSGISVHFRTPIYGKDGEYVQTDFMLVSDVKFAQFVLSNDEVPPFKGMHRAVVLANLAKNINLRWSGIKGLTSRETNAVVEDSNTDRISQILLGDTGARARNLLNIKSILTFLLKKYKDVNIVKSMLSDADQTISRDGIDMFSLIDQSTTLNESVDSSGERVGVQHLYSQYKPESYSMSFENFVKLTDALKKAGGVIQPGNSSVSEKADGLSIKFGIDPNNKFFLQGSYSGPVTDGNFKGKINYEPVRLAFEENFNKIKKLVYKPLLRYKKDLNLEGIRVQAEWLYSPFALTRENIPGIVYFVATNYEQDKLGKWSTFPIINVTDYKGRELNRDIVNDIVYSLVDLTTDEVKFIPLDIDVFDSIDLSDETNNSIQEIKIFKAQNPNYEDILYNTSRKREDQKAKKDMRSHLVRILLPYQEKMHNKILRKLDRLAGKLGEYEGLVIKIQQPGDDPFVFKVISPSFHKNKGRI